MRMRCVSIQHVVNAHGTFVWNVEFISQTNHNQFPMGHAELSFAEMTNYVVGQWYEVAAVEFKEASDVAHPA